MVGGRSASDVDDIAPLASPGERAPTVRGDDGTRARQHERLPE
jgi:hypothetical protein